MVLPATIAVNGSGLKLPDVRQLARMPSWPEWVSSRLASMRDESQPDPKSGNYRTVPTLPANSILSATERDEISRHIGGLDALCGPTPIDSAAAEGAMLIDLTRMMLVLPAAAQNEASAEARGAAYLAALEDLPPWAVLSAIRRWYRGDAGTNAHSVAYDFHWAPAPAELRRVAMTELWRIKGRAETLRKLLRAEPLIEYNDEHRRGICERLAMLEPKFGIPPVGKDGSGG
jgi:hypothetical protein